MTPAFAVVSEPRTVYRVARKPHAWGWPDWAHAEPDGTFGNRWDDPDGIFRVLYACSERVGAFVETLARFRPSAALIAGLDAIAGDDDTLPPGTVPASWRVDRTIGVARINGRFVDIGRAESLATLTHMFAGRLAHYRLRELDAAVIRSQAPRRLTQEISRLIYEQTTPDGQPSYAGIFYHSRLGDDLNNWAIFERDRVEIAPEPDTDISPDDEDFRAAIRLLGLRLVG